MADQPNDTKSRIFQCYKRQLVETGSNVSISDLVEACDISRKTFYYHFLNENDLRMWGFRFEIDNALRACCPENSLVFGKVNGKDKYRGLAYYSRKLVQARIIDCSDFFSALAAYFSDGSRYLQMLARTHDSGSLRTYLYDLYEGTFKLDIAYIAGKRALPSTYANHLASWMVNSSVLFYYDCAVNATEDFPSSLISEMPNFHHERLMDTIEAYFHAHESKYMVPFAYSNL